MQNQLIFWPNSDNVGKMYYQRQWMRLSANAINGGFITIVEQKTDDTLELGSNAYGHAPAFYLSADQAPGGGTYTLLWEDSFDPGTYPVPINQWFLVEFATLPSAGNNGYAWAAINGHVLKGPFVWQSAPYSYPASGAHTGPTRNYDQPVNRIFVDMAYSDGPRPITVDETRTEIWDHFPPDASLPHP